MSITSKERNYFTRLCTTKIAEDNEKIYCVSFAFSRLYEIDKKTGEVINLKIKRNESEPDFSYYSIEKVNEKLILIPLKPNEIVVYDLISKSADYIELKSLDYISKRKEVAKNAKFVCSYSKDNYVYLLGAFYPAIIKFNVDTYETEYITEWVGRLEEKKNFDYNLVTGCTAQGDKLFMSMGYYPSVMVMDTKDNSIEIIKINTPYNGFSGICLKEDDIWLTTFGEGDNGVVRYNMISGRTDNINIIKKESRINFPFSIPYCIEDYVYIMPQRAKHVFKIDVKTNNVEIVNSLDFLFDEEDVKQYLEVRCYPIKQIDEIITFIETKDFSWIEYNTKTDTFDRNTYPYQTDFESRIAERSCEIMKANTSNQVNENSVFSLNRFLDYLINSEITH
ncbi:MAG: hypothetical protein K6B41_03550 [Butyrivibrio sp.]|nr:hypothetical protein [Butyrivibrio sp.]